MEMSKGHEDPRVDLGNVQGEIVTPTATGVGIWEWWNSDRRCCGDDPPFPRLPSIPYPISHYSLVPH
jgi:hypothetical protein